MATENAQQAIVWGSVGRTSQEPLPSSDDEREGLVRVLGNPESGVEYVLERVGGLSIPVWRKVKGRYEMDLNDLVPITPWSLKDLVVGLQGKKRFYGNEKVLSDLDDLFRLLLTALEGLHAKGFAAGLLHPGNVIAAVKPESTELRLILPDAGFVRFRGLIPDWMSKNAYQFLWDLPGEVQNEWAFDREAHPELARKFADADGGPKGKAFDPQRDLRTVARLMSWALERGTQARKTVQRWNAEGVYRAPVWRVLNQVMDGTLNTARGFRDALADETCRPSQHIVEQNEWEPLKTPWWRRALVPAGSLLGLGAIGLGVWLAVSHGPGDPPRAPHTLCPDCPGSSKLYDLLVEYVKAEKNPEAELAALRKMYAPGVLDEARATVRAEEEKCRAARLDESMDRLRRDGEELPREFYRRGVATPDLRERAAALKTLYEKFFMLKAGHAPAPQEYDSWLKQLVGLGSP
jgi:hypothetical protein